MELILPKKRLSYSQWHLWRTNKEAYRRKYYEGEEPPETVETIFGKKIAELLAENHKDLAHIPRYSEPEYRIETHIGNVPVLGYIDSYDPDNHKFREYKTSHSGRNGKPYWTNLSVKKHDQLPFYSLLIETEHGSVDNICHLDWLETRFKKKTIDFQGMELEAEIRELELTGHIQTFERKIFKYERKLIKESIINVANEINEDYARYRERTLPKNGA